MNNKRVAVVNDYFDDPNRDLIVSYLYQEFPETNEGKPEPILEGVMKEMIGSRQVRSVGAPTLESQVAMREVVRACIKAGHPIPILVVSGPKKTETSASIDLAELSALKVLACLNKRVKAYFPQGIMVKLRLEDITGYYLEEGVVGLHKSIDRYIGDLSALIRILGYDFITPVCERELMMESQFRKTAGDIFPLIMSYLTDSEAIDESKWEELDSWKKLSAVGWQSTIPSEMRYYYHTRYQHLFPEYGVNARLAVTAKYFAGTLARYKLNATGVDPSWPGYFQINFATPVPGIPNTLTKTRLYYRTVPFNESKRHIPFWRAKGVLKINGSIRTSLLCWNEPFDCTPFAINFSNANETVTVQSDYLIED